MALGGLWNVGEARGAIARAPFAERFSVERDLARERRKKAQQGSQERRLAAAVGPEEAHDLAAG